MNTHGLTKVVFDIKTRTQKTVPLTQAEADARIAEWNANKEKSEEYDRLHGYKDKRKREYSEIGDQLDAIWKHLLYYRDTLNQPLQPEANLMLEKVLAVKAQFPKPE